MDFRMNASPLASASPSQGAGPELLLPQTNPLSPDVRRDARGSSTKPEVSYGAKELDELFQKAEEMSRIFGRDIKFRYKKEADLYQVEVIDLQDQKVIRKIPPDEIVSLIENINEMLGALFDKKF
ncbi:flagellar protein FlaG protein [Aminomonas paucivorans DSM 12260]|uniref:Flagellar protein FlaG protein n=1 Tax=Aminomonas paucivorans DSM 12260 TaxID=584708 RepID=E3CXD8_9BACT|nr:flagellar protein FlaG protein [Aminomonas paucivorans DSM 12260]